MCEVITIETLMQSAPRGVQLARKKGDLAYVLHTSGSTGKPVGVEVLRDGLSNFMAAMANELTLSVADTLLAVTTIAFDIAELELLLPLTLGGRVVVADEAMLRDPRRLAARLAQGDITAMQATPATWQTLLDAGWDGARDFKALVGGERLPRALADAVAGRVGDAVEPLRADRDDDLVDRGADRARHRLGADRPADRQHRLLHRR